MEAEGATPRVSRSSVSESTAWGAACLPPHPALPARYPRLSPGFCTHWRRLLASQWPQAGSALPLTSAVAALRASVPPVSARYPHGLPRTAGTAASAAMRQETRRGKFSLGAPRPLLLASISDAAGGGKPLGLLPRLPDPAALQATLQEPLQRLAGQAKAPAGPSERRPHRKQHLRAPDLTPQLTAAAAVAGGVLAAISQAAQRVAAARPRLHGRRAPNLPFHQSFRLPWDRRGPASGSARCAHTGSGCTAVAWSALPAPAVAASVRRLYGSSG